MSTQAVTPMMAQYMEIKADYPGALLFYRMGDFYEMFFDDAVAAAGALDIALTKRGKHGGEDIAMCGVPVHAAEGYLLTLIRKGFRVAVCEQMESPEEAKKRGYKAVVRREVVRLVTPGTLTEESLLEPRRHNFLASFAEVRSEGALAWVDISTGVFRVARCGSEMLGPQLARLTPREVLLSENAKSIYSEIVSDLGAAATFVSPESYDSEAGRARLCEALGVKTLDAFGKFGRAELAAMGALVAYLELTQKGRLPLLRAPVIEDTGSAMQIDAATRRNLELTQSLSGGREGSLIHVIDRTLTAGGGRLLERRISSPSRKLDEVTKRLDAVEWAQDGARRGALRDALRRVPDMDRALSRLSLDRGGPRDLAAIRNGLAQAEVLAETLTGDLPELIAEAASALLGHDTLADLLENALVAEPPLLARDGGFIATGYDAELDEVRTLRDEGRGVIAAMQAGFVDETGITALKIKHNNVLGYFIECTATHAEKMMNPPLSDKFIHRQTTANAIRFTTVELSELETRILNAAGRSLEIEKRLYSALRETIMEESAAINHAARALSELDLACALADLASEENWVRPKVDEGRAFKVLAGRHPVVEAALRRDGGQSFIANDCGLSDGREGAHVWLLTGPNMAGKSTFLRQNAIIALLAQAGSFVPAKEAHIGLVSSLFSRVGAADDLARGRSTFMVEMVETAAILNQADDRSLVILDEIGRGTATYDGLSIAWAVMEHLHDINRTRALFATHYHEMTALSAKLDGAENATVAVKEWNGDVIFLHEVRMGAAEASYGVQVAKLAGLPDAVVSRARLVLEQLEKGEREGGGKEQLIDELPLFAAIPVRQPAPPPASDEIKEKLAGILPDELTPREALELIYELKRLAPD